jgi:hypothetical protein
VRFQVINYATDLRPRSGQPELHYRAEEPGQSGVTTRMLSTSGSRSNSSPVAIVK